MQKDNKLQLSPTTIRLHWIVALIMIGLLGTGIYMSRADAYGLYSWHKSFGLLITIFVLWRVIWRVVNGWPEHVAQYKKNEIVLSKIVHYMLLIGTIVMPISGILMSVMGGHDLPFFGLELLADNIDPSDPEQVLPRNEAVADRAATIHNIAGWTIVVAVILHVGGAIKHHLIDKDSTLKRMLGMQ